ncbi:olfactory receptor 1020-like isoform X1 [Microcaecilia unicolor]|uniref:Olfactory receptor n=1 Tax=Microcaecilia unicolor TaxID=1415580 RepID=A0A6P7ZI38_9AMPH|nr:olfactory receptor 1020-like isoform X1 [Microcaecilia unicolor]
MTELNQTSITVFLLLGFTNVSYLKTLLFVVFLGMYLVTLLGNLGILLLIHLDPRLHTPMYFFLSHLAFVDLGCSSTITPKTLVNFLSEKRTISYLGCAAQLYFFVAFACTDNFILAAMAYDRYVAISNPLLYPVIMTRRLCTQLVIFCYFTSFLYSLIQTGTTFRLSFCSSNEINHFFCDFLPLLKLSCTDTHINEVVLPFFVASVTFSSILVILVSYISIFFTILRMRSKEGRRKAFSTCASHLTSVTLFYGTVLFMYLRPTSSYSLEQDRIVSVFYTVVIPMLNPLIYSLRNQEVKAAVRKSWQKMF